MAIVKPPLNFFKRVTTSLTRQLTSIYSVPPLERATVFINTLATNTVNQNRTVTLAISTNNIPGSLYTFLNESLLEKLDVKNLGASKLVLGADDVLFAQADIEDLRTIDDPNALWEFDLPFTVTQLSGLNISFTTNTTVTADFGTEGLTVYSDSIPLTSTVPVNFTYDVTEDVGVNLTLSLLEVVNTP